MKINYHTLISQQELEDNINNPDWVIVDCSYDLLNPDSGYQTYLSGHIPAAVFADLQHDLSGPPITDNGRHPLPSEQKLLVLFTKLGISNDSQVIIYDNASGAFAGRLWWLLRYMGHKRVAVLDGGMSAWINAGAQLDTEQHENPAGRFNGSANADWLIQVDDIPGQTLLIDSRDTERYRGDNEPIDKAAGHIPGAINRPWKQNLDNDGHFKSSATLQAEFSQLYSDNKPDSAVFYCGSGVTACHNILATAHAGLLMPRLYAGSWSEWCADPKRPVKTGENPGVLLQDPL